MIEVLRCPVCAGGLERSAGSLRCPSGHSFDVARQGYVNLLPGGVRVGTADTADMVRARADFLTAGHYAPLADLLAGRADALCEGSGDGVLLDAGAGTGYYLGAVLDRHPSATGLAFDVSKYAARRAARAHPRATAAVTDTWRSLPVRDGSISVVLNVFAPRNGAEFRRVLRSDGRLLVVTPTARHLADLVSEVGMLTVDASKDERVDSTLSSHFRAERRTEHDLELTLTSEDVANLVRMGPSAHHVTTAELDERLAALGFPFRTTASVTIATYLPG